MKITKSVTVEVTLVLNKDEAEWLHMVMQNPLTDTLPEDESTRDNEMRRKFWMATDVGVV